LASERGGLRGAGFVLMRGRWDGVWGYWRRWEKTVIEGRCWCCRLAGGDEGAGE